MHLTSIALFALSVSISGANPSGSDLGPCPDSALGETQNDCPWAAITRAILAGQKEGKSATPFFLKHAPILVRDIKIDSKKKHLIDLWGESINYDEFAKARILEPIILKTLYRFFLGTVLENVQDKQIVHAGVEHTYGYLLSNLKTAFGYKRARWVSGDIEKGFDLPSETFGPSPKPGTLLGNISFFAGSIAMRYDPSALALVKKITEIPHELSGFKFENLKITRIEEAVKIDNRIVLLRTDFVSFPHGKTKSENSHLLIYSVSSSAQIHPVLITAFPVQEDFVAKKTNPKTLGEKVQITTQYNAFVSGLTGLQIEGSRKILESKP